MTMQNGYKIVHLYSHAESDVRGQNGVVTIVSRPGVYALGTSEIEYGLAYCRPGDNFCKQTGIDLATARLGNKNLAPTVSGYGKIDYDKKPWKYREILLAMIKDILANQYRIPDWARNILEEEAFYQEVLTNYAYEDV